MHFSLATTREQNIYFNNFDEFFGFQFADFLLTQNRLIPEHNRTYLFGHELVRTLVHLGVVYADAAEDGEGLEHRDVRLVKPQLVVLNKKGIEIIVT